jgi:serine/threonine protein kinase
MKLINHKNIVELYDVITLDDTIYIIMEVKINF